jgi:hypothetical protein
MAQPAGLCRPIRPTCRNRLAANGERAGEADRIGPHCESGDRVPQVAIRVAQRILAMAAGIWHNNKLGAPVTRSLIAYDH